MLSVERGRRGNVNGVADHVEGHGGLDWYFARLSGPNQDQIDGLTAGEIEVDIR